MYSILYVDDEPDLLELAKLFLESTQEFSVDTKTSAKEALHALCGHRYDAIISDFQMPRMNGIDLLKEVRSSIGNVPFILFTGKGREEVVIDALNFGADFYLQKGGNPETLFTELMHVTRRTIQLQRAEASLREKEQRYHDLQNATDLIQSVSPDGHFLFVNKKWQDTLGYQESELAGMTLFDIIHEESREHCRALFPRVITGEDVGIIDVTFKARDGRKVYAEGFASCKLIGGKPQYTRGIFKDVTGRKVTEAALKENEGKFRTIFTHSPYPIAINSMPDQKFLAVNPAFLAASGYTEAEVLGKDPVGMGLLTLTEAAKLLSRVVTTGKIENVPLTLTAKEGRKVQVLFSTIPVTISGRPASMTVTAEVTQLRKVEEELIRKNEDLHAAYEELTATEKELREKYRELTRQEKALRESEEKYRLLTEVTSDIIYMMDATGTITHISPQVSAYGYTPEEIVSHGFTEFLAKEDGTKALETLKETLSSKRLTITPLRIRDKAGNLHWMEDNGAPVLDAAGSVIAISGILRDITGRKLAEEALKESEEKFRALVEHSLEGFFIIDFSGKLLFTNQAAGRIIDAADHRALVGKRNVMEFVSPESHADVIRDIGQVARGIDAYLVHYKLVTENRREIWVECIGKKIPFGNSPAMLVSMRDVTERKKAEEALRLANRKLTLLSGITRHDVLNKIAVITGHLALARKRGPDQDYPVLMDKIESSVNIIRSQVEFTRLYQDLGTKDPEWQKPGQLLAGASVPAHVTLNNELGDEEVFADLMLEKVFQNMVDNSLRHGGNVTEIRLLSRKDPDGLTILYEDNGIGIPPGEKDLVFERGYGKNTGLGLFLAREILGITGMTIRETGKEGEGARFEIHAPENVYRITPV